MTTKIILFDFDGVLVDSLDVYVEISNSAGSQFGFGPISRESVRLHGMGGLIRQSNMTADQVAGLFGLAKKQFSLYASRVARVAGFDAVLPELAREFQLGILTSNSKENVSAFLTAQGWIKFFSHIEGDGNFFAKDQAIEEFLKNQQWTKKKILYVGDETRDIESCRRAGVSIISAAWGFESQERLESFHPDYLAKEPAHLIELARQWSGGLLIPA